MTPSTTGRDEALPVGGSYVDPAIPLTITVLSANALGATISVQFQAQPSPTPTPTPNPTPSPSPLPSPTQTATPVVSVSTDRPSYSVNQTVSTRALVLSAGLPVVGANVSIALTKPNGSTVTLGGTTGSDGSVTVKYRVNKKDPKGSYDDSALTTVNGDSAPATTSFVVK